MTKARAVQFLGHVVSAMYVAFGLTQRAQAHPTFAHALSVDCRVCHMEVPALNAYGRYIARTNYMAIPRSALKGTFPFYGDYNPTYDSHSQPFIEYGNVAVHAGGYIADDWTYHVHQWIYQNSQGGGTDHV